MKWARICASRPMACRQQSARESPSTSNVSGFQDIHDSQGMPALASPNPWSRVHIRLSSYVYLGQPPARSPCLVAVGICFSVAERIPLSLSKIHPYDRAGLAGKTWQLLLLTNYPPNYGYKGTRASSVFIFIFHFSTS